MQRPSQIDAMNANTHYSAVVFEHVLACAAHVQHNCQTFMGAATLSSTCAPPDRGKLPPPLACSSHTAVQHVTVQKA